MRALRRALGEGLRGMARSPVVQVVAIGAVAVSLLLVGALRLGRANLDRVARQLNQGVELVIYLEEGVPETRARQMMEVLGKLPGVAGVRLVEAKEARERLRRSLGDRAALLDGVEEGMLPTSLEVSLEGGAEDASRLAPVLERVRRMPGVEDVEEMGEWVERLLAIERALAMVGVVLAALGGLSCLFVIGASIRLGVHARREEIEILKLCGATDRFVAAPFLVEGVLQGIGGAALGMLLLYGMFRALAPAVEQALGVVLAAAPLGFLGTGEVMVTIVLGGAVGLVASYVAVGRYVEV